MEGLTNFADLVVDPDLMDFLRNLSLRISSEGYIFKCVVSIGC